MVFNIIHKNFDNYIKTHNLAVSKLNKLIPEIHNTIELINQCYDKNGKILFFGKGVARSCQEVGCENPESQE